jgi:hypothetical protein
MRQSACKGAFLFYPNTFNYYLQESDQMAEDLSDQEVDDMYATTTAAIWDRLPKAARQGVLRELSPDDRNDVAIAVRHGRRVIRTNQSNQ